MRINEKWKRNTAFALVIFLCLSTVFDSGAVRAKEAAESEKYAVTVGVCENGRIVFESSRESGHYYARGEIVEARVKPDAGYELQELTVTDEKENSMNVKREGNAISFSMPDADVVVSAVFSAVEEEEAVAEAEEDGSEEDKSQQEEMSSAEKDAIPENSGGQEAKKPVDGDSVEVKEKEAADGTLSVEESVRQALEQNANILGALEDEQSAAVPMSPSKVKAAEKTEIQVKAKATYKYADYNLGTGETKRYEVTFEDPDTGDERTVYAYCIQPKKKAPGDCVCKMELLHESKLASKVIYYGTEDLSGSDSFWEVKYHMLAIEDGAKWIITHIAASKASGDSDWDYGANSEAADMAKELIAYAGTCKASFPDPEVSFSQNHVAAYVDTDAPGFGDHVLQRQRTPVITFRGDLNNKVNLALPGGVICWNADSGFPLNEPNSGGSDVEIRGGTSFYFTASLDQAEKVSSVFRVKTHGSIKKTYRTYKLTITYGQGDYQNLGMILGAAVPAGERELSLTVDWLTVGDLHIEKYVRTAQDTDTAQILGKKLAGVTFYLLDKEGKKVAPTRQNGITGDMDASGLITVRQDGCADVKNIPAGTYNLREVDVPLGYQVPRNDSPVSITTGEKESVLVFNDQVEAGISVQKHDAETGEPTPQGGAGFENAQFKIVALQDCIIKMKHYKSGDVVYRDLTLDKDGYAETPADALSEGRYRLEETKASVGYLAGGSVEFAITKDDHGKKKAITGGEITDPVIRGGVKIKKVDKDTGKSSAQGEATLEGARFEIVNLNERPVKVDGVKYGRGQVVRTLEIGRDGTARTDSRLLPYGTYAVREVSGGQPKGYLWNGENYREFSVTQNGSVVDLSGKPMEDSVIRGGVRILKYDGESGENHPLGGASLKNMEIAVYNESGKEVSVSGHVYQPGEIVHVMYTDDKGCAETPADLLPYGSYRLVETEPPEGYMGRGEDDRGVYEQTFTVTRHGEIVDKLQGEKPMTDFVKRGDFSIRKINADTQKSMAGVTFRITSLATGESHMFVTDANGYYSTSSSYIPHTRNTNGGKLRDGIWFGLRTDGGSVKADDSLGALPYDTYRIEELPGENNRGMAMFYDILTISEEKETVELGTIENQEIAIGTAAKDSLTGTHYQAAAKGACIVDTVFYQNLDKGISYTLKGTLINKANGEVLKDAEGNLLSAEKTFRPAISTGSVDVEFVFDASGLAGMDIVVYEELYDGDKKLAEHKDIGEEGQTIYYPGIGTRAVDGQTSAGVSLAEEAVTLIDTVSYTNLQPGRAYRLTGTLMVKETGEAYADADGKPVTASRIFVPETPSGAEEVVFTFNGVNAAGRTLVVFEELSRGGQIYAVHADIDEESQTVLFPEIATTACVENTGDRIAMAAALTVTDTVTYRNLKAGQEYRIAGALMIKETGRALEENGVPVTVERTFVAEESSGFVDMKFTFDAENLAGNRVVIFEELYRGNWLVASHKDPEDEGQTIYIPKIQTDAADAGTGDHAADADEEIVIKDTVTYTDLISGKTYKVVGTLMDRETGEAIKDDGKEVTAEEVFRPTEADGAIDVTFRFNGISLGGRTVVAFETLLYNDVEIAVHRDLQDERQSVTLITVGAVDGAVREKEKKDRKPSDVSGVSVQAVDAVKTGDTGKILFWGILGLVSLGILIVLLARRRKGMSHGIQEAEHGKE